uniref:TEX10-like TPR repeats domain-containing protein n=1 Tax=Percolomonas cosmopolitus TaxID=63605 RepID=A0A7S1KLU6_9EUKA|eukprot:CAMPEP_0117437234 /NCGR_PEP_ID=MMETSP0759-20121206/1419_1 /TAXON_ID=63605 /ORGANISM="Percolomonas cosmopolitus, Strain WS" /LENGTH=921 /DNA_ID=CAMNT_0005228861 /DNA_START=84 /DNA_END=2849 /DNA_ORIENTATION=+
MPSMKRKQSSSNKQAKKKRKLGKPKPQPRLELHTKQLKLNQQNLRTAGTASEGSGHEASQSEAELIDQQDKPKIPLRIATFRNLSLNDVFNKLEHYSSKECAVALEQLAELLRRFPQEMKIHQYDISKKIVHTITEHDDPHLRSAAIRVLTALFQMMKSTSTSGSTLSGNGSGYMIEQVVMRLFVSCVCSIMSDMMVRLRAFGIDVTLLLIEYFPEAMAAHAYKLLPTLENVFLMTKLGHSYKGENYKVIHERSINCLNQLTFVLFQYGSKLSLSANDIHTHCHNQVNLKQLTRGRNDSAVSLEQQQFVERYEKRARESDFYDTSLMYQSFGRPGKKNVELFLDVMNKRESEKGRLEAIEVTLSNLFTPDEAVAEGLLYSLDSSFSLYKFCDRMFRTITDKWVETIHKGSQIQNVKQAGHIKALLQLMYNLFYSIEHQNGVGYQTEIMKYLQDAIHHVVSCMPFSASLQVSSSSDLNLNEINNLLVSVLSFACCWRLSRKKKLSKATTLMKWESLFLSFFQEQIQSHDISHHDFGMLIGAFHRMEPQLPDEYRTELWEVLTNVFLREKTLSVRQRLLLHYLGDMTLEEEQRLPPPHLLEKWVDRIAKMLAAIPDNKLSLVEKLLRVVRCFSMKAEYTTYINGKILESIPDFFYNNTRQMSTFTKLEIEFQQQAVHLLHCFSSFSVELVRALSKACSNISIPARIITQIVETLRFRQQQIDTKTHISFLISLITGLVQRTTEDQDLILHEIIINIFTFENGDEPLLYFAPIVTKFLDSDSLDTNMVCILLKTAFSAFNAASDDKKSGELWTFTIPDVMTDILCDKSSKGHHVLCVQDLVFSNEDQFVLVLKNVQDRLNDDENIADLTRAFSRLVDEAPQRLKHLFLSNQALSMETCLMLKDKNPAKKEATSMESRLKLLFDQ